MAEEQFNEFFKKSLQKLTNEDNIKILKNKIQELDEKYSDDILIHSTFFGCMIKAFRKNKIGSDIITYLISDWNNSYEMSDLIILIITNFNCEPIDMKYIINTIDVPEYDYIIEYIIQHKEKLLFSVMYENINFCFSKKLTCSLIQKQIHLARLYDNDTVENYLEMKQYQLDEFKPKPNHVYVKEGESRSMLETVDQGQDQTKLQIKDDLSTLSDKYIKSLSFNTKNEFNIEEALNIFMATRAEGLNSDTSHVNIRNRLWGPVNAIPNRNCYNNKNGIGPCRMLNCECKEEENETWFTGCCNECNSKIRNISYAVRFPLEKGGWLGCYCSFECIRKSPPVGINENIDIIMTSVIDTLQKDGIFDRICG